MIDSILLSEKNLLGIEESDKTFDEELIQHINGIFFTLEQLGVGPENGFYITDDKAKWEDYDKSGARWTSLRSYIYLRLRKLFDPPASSVVMQSIDNQIAELTWRLALQAERRSS